MGYDIALFYGATARYAFRRDHFEHWAELADSLEYLVQDTPAGPIDAPPAEQKTRLIAFGPYKMRCNHRLNENITHLSLIVLDVDTDCDPDAIAERLDGLGDALMYASPSDTPKDRRVRVIVPANRPITPNESKGTRYALAARLGLSPDCGVRRAHDAARLFFVGRLHGSPERDVWRFGA